MQAIASRMFLLLHPNQTAAKAVKPLVWVLIIILSTMVNESAAADNTQLRQLKKNNAGGGGSSSSVVQQYQQGNFQGGSSVMEQRQKNNGGGGSVVQPYQNNNNNQNNQQQQQNKNQNNSNKVKKNNNNKGGGSGQAFFPTFNLDMLFCNMPFKSFCSSSSATKQWVQAKGYNMDDKQLYAMVDFYFSTRNTESYGPLYDKGWLDGNNPCWWDGIICGYTNEIETIHLPGIGLEGTLPSSLALLTKLESIYLEQNQLSDEIPSELGTLTSLNSLHLNGNNFIGKVPTEICGDEGIYTYITADCGGSTPEIECQFPGCCSECYYF